MNVFDNALSTLNNTVGSITNKVEEQKGRANEYKAYIIAELGKLSAKIQTLRTLGSCETLKREIADLKQQLQAKTDELTTANNSATALQTQVRELHQQIDTLTSQIADKDAQIKQLNSANSGKDGEIGNLQNEKRVLEEQKQTAEHNLASVNERMSGEITAINNRLQEQIKLIDTIMDELSNEGNKREMDSQFNLINRNIDDIVSIVNSPGQAGATTGSVREIIDAINAKNAKTKDSSSSSSKGGKRKTMKRRRKRTCKSVLKGGYVYSSSSKLDKSSSIISSSSKDKSPTKKVKPTKKKHRQLVTL